MGKTTTYAQCGVHLDANDRWVARLQGIMRSTLDLPVGADRRGIVRVCGPVGGFAGWCHLGRSDGATRNASLALVACTDGVGSKVLLAQEAGRLDGLGVDVVAMVVNDLITCGADPLFFLDYLSVYRIESGVLVKLAEGMAEGCCRAGCAFLGGETAEMPDLHPPGHLDVVGFATGVAQTHRIIDGSRVGVGDVLVGLRSNGVHANGFTLVRRLLADHGLALHDSFVDADAEREGTPQRQRPTVADVLLVPTRIYVGPVLETLRGYRTQRPITGMAHITGGGLPGNLARIVPPGCTAEVDTRSWEPPPVFGWLSRMGVRRREMFRVFNMGVGFVLAVRPRFVAGVRRRLEAAGESPVVIGHVRAGRRRVVLR